MGSINNILTKKIDKETEKFILEKLKIKMISGFALYVSTIRRIEKKYGKDAVDDIRKLQLERSINRMKKKSKETDDNSLLGFCKMMENSCAGTHEWEKNVDMPDKQSYRYTRCMLAEIFQELNAVDIGLWICEADGPAAKAYNSKIKFKRTKTLMNGDDYCDHQYFY